MFRSVFTVVFIAAALCAAGSASAQAGALTVKNSDPAYAFVPGDTFDFGHLVASGDARITTSTLTLTHDAAGAADISAAVTAFNAEGTTGFSASVVSSTEFTITYTAVGATTAATSTATLAEGDFILTVTGTSIVDDSDPDELVKLLLGDYAQPCYDPTWSELDIEGGVRDLGSWRISQSAGGSVVAQTPHSMYIGPACTSIPVANWEFAATFDSAVYGGGAANEVIVTGTATSFLASISNPQFRDPFIDAYEGCPELQLNTVVDFVATACGDFYQSCSDGSHARSFGVRVDKTDAFHSTLDTAIPFEPSSDANNRNNGCAGFATNLNFGDWPDFTRTVDLDEPELVSMTFSLPEEASDDEKAALAAGRLVPGMENLAIAFTFNEPVLVSSFFLFAQTRDVAAECDPNTVAGSTVTCTIPTFDPPGLSDGAGLTFMVNAVDRSSNGNRFSQSDSGFTITPSNIEASTTAPTCVLDFVVGDKSWENVSPSDTTPLGELSSVSGAAANAVKLGGRRKPLITRAALLDSSNYFFCDMNLPQARVDSATFTDSEGTVHALVVDSAPASFGGATGVSFRFGSDVGSVVLRDGAPVAVSATVSANNIERTVNGLRVSQVFDTSVPVSVVGRDNLAGEILSTDGTASCDESACTFSGTYNLALFGDLASDAVVYVYYGRVSDVCGDDNTPAECRNLLVDVSSSVCSALAGCSNDGDFSFSSDFDVDWEINLFVDSQIDDIPFAYRFKFTSETPSFNLDDDCFESHSSFVTVENVGLVPLIDLRAGDRIASVDDVSGEPIFTDVTVRKDARVRLMMTVEMDSGERLRMVPGHMLYSATRKAMVPARDVRDDGTEQVLIPSTGRTATVVFKTAQRCGGEGCLVTSVWTENCKLVVNGVLVSCTTGSTNGVEDAAVRIATASVVGKINRALPRWFAYSDFHQRFWMSLSDSWRAALSMSRAWMPVSA